MDQDEKSGLYLSIRECKSLFKILKRDESRLSDDELFILHKIESALYSELSIKDIEELGRQDKLCRR